MSDFDSLTPREQAQEFMKLIEQFTQTGAPEGVRLKAAIEHAVEEWGKSENRDEATVLLAARMQGIEIGVWQLIGHTVSKMRDTMATQIKRAGKAKEYAGALDALGDMVKAIDAIVAASGAGGSAEKVEQARNTFHKARQRLVAAKLLS